jgi:hypothetical protein
MRALGNVCSSGSMHTGSTVRTFHRRAHAPTTAVAGYLVFIFIVMGTMQPGTVQAGRACRHHRCYFSCNGRRYCPASFCPLGLFWPLGPFWPLWLLGPCVPFAPFCPPARKFCGPVCRGLAALYIEPAMPLHRPPLSHSLSLHKNCALSSCCAHPDFWTVGPRQPAFLLVLFAFYSHQAGLYPTSFSHPPSLFPPTPSPPA